ncbi:MBL fold metallo-hydrolase [Paenisporosarcina sp. NPDC076898]|uniref:MBL fold metallo-hydrolase n=1 Tax=unclassified Paenisporosarcina TaxID=2642018 RepID=UPI003CFDE4A1
MKCLFQIVNCELYSFTFDPIDSRMYMIISNEKALIVDPCVDVDALELLNDRKVVDVIVLPTHEHYDHISGINWLKDNLNCRVIAIEQCAKNLPSPRYNASAHFEALFLFSAKEIQDKIADKNIQPYSCNADEVFQEYKSFKWENHKVEIIKSPGHSQGSVCIIIDDIYIFTGDSLIKGVPTITRLPGGSKKEYEKITLPFLKSLPQASIIFPGHGEAGHIHEFLL